MTNTTKGHHTRVPAAPGAGERKGKHLVLQKPLRRMPAYAKEIMIVVINKGNEVSVSFGVLVWM